MIVVRVMHVGRESACAVEAPKYGNETSQSLQQSSQLNDAGDRHRSSRLNDNGGWSQLGSV